MKIHDFQCLVRDRLNAVESLVRGGCKAFAEDTRTVYNEADAFTQSGGVALVVVTPDIQRSAADGSEGTPVEGKLLLRCVECCPLADAAGTLRALDAAEVAAHVLESETITWAGIRQTSDLRTRTFTATAEFDFSLYLT